MGCCAVGWVLGACSWPSAAELQDVPCRISRKGAGHRWWVHLPALARDVLSWGGLWDRVPGGGSETRLSGSWGFEQRF